MCFSATASFTAATLLGVVGVLTLRKARGLRELPLAAVPLLFGLQQLTEGVLWLSLRHHWPGPQTFSIYLYSLFSHVLWPVLVPLAILLVEPGRQRRNALRVFLVAGLSVASYLLYFIIKFPVTAHVHNRSISYDSTHLFLAGVLILYLSATCVSGLFSSHRCINIFGALAFLLAIAAYEVSVTTFVSVWCFYAAVLSLLIYLHFSGPMQACRAELVRSRDRRAVLTPRTPTSRDTTGHVAAVQGLSAVRDLIAPRSLRSSRCRDEAAAPSVTR